MNQITIEEQIAISEQNVAILDERIAHSSPSDDGFVQTLRARDTYKEIVRNLTWIRDNHIVTNESALAAKLASNLNVEFRDYFDWQSFLETNIIKPDYLDEAIEAATKWKTCYACNLGCGFTMGVPNDEVICKLEFRLLNLLKKAKDIISQTYVDANLFADYIGRAKKVARLIERRSKPEKYISKSAPSLNNAMNGLSTLKPD